MKASTKTAWIFVGGLTAFSLISIPPVKPQKKLVGYKYHVVKKIISKKNIRSGSTGRSYSGGGSSYGK